jgi:hypothetical protein
VITGRRKDPDRQKRPVGTLFSLCRELIALWCKRRQAWRWEKLGRWLLVLLLLLGCVHCRKLALHPPKLTEQIFKLLRLLS